MKEQDLKSNKLQYQQQISKLSKIRFPFMQRQGSATPPTTVPTPPSPPSSNKFFNIRKFGSKQPAPLIPNRKTVSFAQKQMDYKTKVVPDHTDVAYMEAFTKLRNVLNPSTAQQGDYTKGLLNRFIPTPTKTVNVLQPKLEIPADTSSEIYSTLKVKSSTTPGDGTVASQQQPNHLPSYAYPYTQNNRAGSTISTLQNISKSSIPNTNNRDLFGFIDKQGEYITQLEKETTHCRNELSKILDKVRELISENEALHEKQKRDMLTSMIQQLEEKSPDGTKRFDLATNGINGKSDQVIRDSKITELEAQLLQSKRSLRLAQEENIDLRRGIGKISSRDNPCNNKESTLTCELHIREIENLSREKRELMETISKFKQMVNELRDKEGEASRKAKSSLEVVDQIKEEKAQSDLESRRLKEELERHQQRVREMIQENSKKLHEEKLQVEKKYRQEIDHLSNEMSQEFDTLTKAKLDLERQKRVETDLRRELQLKMSIIDDLRVEMQIKLNHFQAELSHTLLQKSSAEQELINSRLQAEKIERDGKQDCSKLQTELNLVRKRLDETDAELRKNQDVIVRLNEQISQLQRDASLARIRLEGHLNPDDGEVNSMIQAMEDKQSRDMTELEQLIQVQNNLLDKLRNECKQLAEKLEETTQQHKKERTILEGEKERVSQKHKISQEKCADLEHKVNFYATSHEQMTSRLHKLEDDDKSRSEKIFTLLSKQSSITKENQNLQNEVSYLKRKLGDGSTGQSSRAII